MYRKFIFFINPISGTKSKDILRQLINKKMEKYIFPYEILNTTAEGDYLFLPAKISSEKITDIIVCGGDGTISQVAACLLAIDIQVGIIPMGSGNGLALAAGISKNISKAIEIIIHGKAAYVDGFNINGYFSCMLCGLGFDAQVAHDFAGGKKRGLLAYIKHAIKNFVTAKVYPFRIEINGATINTEAFFISIANSNQFGNHVTIAPKASLNDGLLDVVIVNKMSKTAMLFSLLRQIKLGKLHDTAIKGFEKNSIVYIQSGKIVIHNPSLAPLHIDGEPAKTNQLFKINVIENAFKLLQP